MSLSSSRHRLLIESQGGRGEPGWWANELQHWPEDVYYVCVCVYISCMFVCVLNCSPLRLLWVALMDSLRSSQTQACRQVLSDFCWNQVLVAPKVITPFKSEGTGSLRRLKKKKKKTQRFSNKKINKCQPQENKQNNIFVISWQG